MTDKVQKIREEVEKLKSQLIRGACSSQIAMETLCKEEAYNEVLAIIDSLQEEPKKCMYAKENYTDEDRKVLCDGCEEECKYAQREEPVSDECIYNRTLEEKQRSCKFCSAACQVRIKESESEDLSAELDAYIKDNFTIEKDFLEKYGLEEKDYMYSMDKSDMLKMIRHFTNNYKVPTSDDLEEAAKLCVSDCFCITNEEDWDEHAVDALNIFKIAAKWKKEQMMAKAVDGDITFDYYGDDDKIYGCIAHDSFCLEDFGLKDRDKVKVIVIKKD